MPLGSLWVSFWVVWGSLGGHFGDRKTDGKFGRKKVVRPDPPNFDTGGPPALRTLQIQGPRDVQGIGGTPLRAARARWRICICVVFVGLC